MIPETVQAPRVVREDGRTPFRAPQAGVDPVDDTHLVTKGWALANLGGGGGGGAPADAVYIVQSASGGLSAERVLTNSFAVEWDWLTPGQVTANLGAGVVPAVLGVAAGYFSLLGHTHDAAEIVSGVLAAARLGTGTPGSGTYLRGDGVWSATSAFAAASHTHAASDITSGTLATARLGGGSASGTTVLLGDSTWGIVPTGAIADDAVTDGKLRNSAALSVIGRSTNSTGDPADIAAGTDGHVLRRSGTSLGFGTTATAGIADNAVTNAKLRDSASLSVIGRSANSSGDPADIAAATDHQVLRRSGTAVGFGAVNLAQSAAVTGALPIANGGTGATTAVAAIAALGAAEAAHGHSDLRAIEIDTSEMGGALAGSGITNLQELIDWLDANLTPP